jgi:hypothetical protein
VMARRYARTIHWTAWKEAVNACAKVGKPALAMLVSSEGMSMESERLASAQRTEGVRSALPVTISSLLARIGFTMTSVFLSSLEPSEAFPLV